MSRYSGRQGRGASRQVRELKRTQAVERQAAYDAKPKPITDNFIDEILAPFGEFE